MGNPAELSEARHTASELALIYAAERLFAENGIAGVALRQINQAANQKNISAAHYHFGSREGLILAVLEHRWLDLDRRRQALLEDESRPRDLRYYVEAMIVTLADELKPRPEGNHYLQFIQQYERYKGGKALARSMSPAGVEIYDRIEANIAYLPAATRKVRMRYLVNLVHGVLATAEHELGLGELQFEDVPMIASNLVDMVVAALSAPLSLDTMAMLDKANVQPVR